MKALITGSSRGIGAEITAVLEANKVEVLAPGRSQLDLSDDRSVDRYLSGLKGGVDILINNAGINPLAAVSELSDKVIDEALRINLVSPLRLARGLLPEMIKNHYGRIVNISSIWSTVSKPKRTIYSVSKAGINAMTRSLAVELAPYNILVNAVAPGFVDTELTRQNNPPQELEKIRSHIPLGRLADSHEIAELVWFLCSENNSYITGQTIVIDGGYTCL